MCMRSTNTDGFLWLVINRSTTEVVRIRLSEVMSSVDGFLNNLLTICTSARTRFSYQSSWIVCVRITSEREREKFIHHKQIIIIIIIILYYAIHSSTPAHKHRLLTTKNTSRLHLKYKNVNTSPRLSDTRLLIVRTIMCLRY